MKQNLATEIPRSINGPLSMLITYAPEVQERVVRKAVRVCVLESLGEDGEWCMGCPKLPVDGELQCPRLTSRNSRGEPSQCNNPEFTNGNK